MSTEPQTTYADRVFRSPAAFVGGILLLVLALWLGGDAVLRGEGNTPWRALAALLCAVPLVVAFTLRPAVYAGTGLLRVRNPFRTITIPWAAVEDVRASYSSEIFAGGKKYQLWSVPVSLRSRKRVANRNSRAAKASDDPYGRISSSAAARGGAGQPGRAPADQTIADLRELAALNAPRPEAQGTPTVRWAYEIMAPAIAGAILLIVVFAMG
ncbi:PH domain-containing protein [Streptomyces beijiangensis]|uniref:PH domain-containing protein n=1 Tax=Streptomyces beijiangensis TaxID=163361 RepID=A0A939FCI8_9ACTN|nr:PH domain-containing protein [Streptomyces beijiangensis]MBO0516103.1 PH domain-containing protein [Streptomyces beijiangensis]